jgi:LysM repeat protein
VLPSNLELVERGETMSQKQRGLLIVALMLIGAILLSACEMPLSTPPAATPTLIPTGLFVSPFPSVENPMEMIEEFARQTAAAQTALVSGGTPGTPSTPSTAVTGTVLTPQTGGTATPSTATPSTPTNAVPTTPVVPAVTITPGGPTLTPLPPGARPSSYTLQKGEFPYCIARRYDINPNELLALNGITNGQIFMPGLTIRIPQTASPFPAPRALQTHPATYTVASSEETVYGVACKYGDVDPALLAQQNGISVTAVLTVGQQLKIP